MKRVSLRAGVRGHEMKVVALAWKTRGAGCWCFRRLQLQSNSACSPSRCSCRARPNEYPLLASAARSPRNTMRRRPRARLIPPIRQTQAARSASSQVESWETQTPCREAVESRRGKGGGGGGGQRGSCPTATITRGPCSSPSPPRCCCALRALRPPNKSMRKGQCACREGRGAVPQASVQESDYYGCAYVVA